MSSLGVCSDTGIWENAYLGYNAVACYSKTIYETASLNKKTSAKFEHVNILPTCCINKAGSADPVLHRPPAKIHFPAEFEAMSNIDLSLSYEGLLSR
jgi:hypothetical protein